MPRVSDGVVFRVLERLLRLDGERLQYKGLHVDTLAACTRLMGFEIQTAAGGSLVSDSRSRGGQSEGPRQARGRRAAEGAEGAGRARFRKDKAAAEVKDAKDVAGLRCGAEQAHLPEAAGPLARRDAVSPAGRGASPDGACTTPLGMLTQPIVETTLRPVFFSGSGLR